MVVLNNAKVFKTNGLTFIVNGKEIIVRAPLNQAFFLVRSDIVNKPGLFTRRMDLIKSKLEKGKLTSIQDLARYTRPVISWRHTDLQFDTSNCEIIEIL